MGHEVFCFSEVGEEFFAEAFPRSCEEGFDGGDGEFHSGSDIGVTHPFEAMQQQGHAMSFAEGLDGFLNDVLDFVAIKDPRGHVCRAVGGEFGGALNSSGGCGGDIDFPTAEFGASGVGGQVVGDMKNPGRESRRGLISIAGSVDAEKDFLSDILGSLLVAELMEEDVDEAVLVAFDELFERNLIACLNAEHQPRVRIMQEAGGETWFRSGHNCSPQVSREVGISARDRILNPESGGEFREKTERVRSREDWCRKLLLTAKIRPVK